MTTRPLLPLIGLAALTFGGCATQVAQIDHNQLKPMAGSIVEDQSVAIETDVWMQRFKGYGVMVKGQQPKPDDELVVRRYDDDRELLKNAFFQDAQVSLGTREMLAQFEPTLEQGIRAGGGMIAPEGASDLVLTAKLTFGPTPAPAYKTLKVGEHILRAALTGGIAAMPEQLRADYTLELTLRDAETGRTLREHTEKVLHTYDEKHSTSKFDFKGQQKAIAAATNAFVDSLEGQLQAFLK